MTTNFSITIFNESNDKRQYLLFMEPPQTSDANSGKVFTNIFAKAPSIPSGNGSNVIFKIQSEFFAVTGTPPAELAKGVSVSTGSYRPVQLGQKQVKQLGSLDILSTYDNPPVPEWKVNNPPLTTTAEMGFGVNTDQTFKYPNGNNIFIGLGARDPFNAKRIVPTATVAARPGSQYTFYPKVKYYVCTGNFSDGEIVDIKEIGTKLEIDFSNTMTPPNVSFTQDNGGVYVPI